MQEVNNTSALEEQLYYIGECKKFLEKKTKEIGRPLYAVSYTHLDVYKRQWNELFRP